MRRIISHNYYHTLFSSQELEVDQSESGDAVPPNDLDVKEENIILIRDIMEQSSKDLYHREIHREEQSSFN